MANEGKNRKKRENSGGGLNFRAEEREQEPNGGNSKPAKEEPKLNAESQKFLGVQVPNSRYRNQDGQKGSAQREVREFRKQKKSGSGGPAGNLSEFVHSREAQYFKGDTKKNTDLRTIRNCGRKFRKAKKKSKHPNSLLSQKKGYEQKRGKKDVAGRETVVEKK